MSAKFSKKEALVFGWDSFKKEWKLLLTVFIGVWVISAILSGISGNLYESDASVAGVLVDILSYVVNAILGVGLLRILLDVTDHKKASWRSLYTEHGKAWRYILATILYGLMVVVGLILLVVPGIYLAVKFQFYAYFIVDKNMGVIESLKHSSKITKGSIMNLFLFGLICVALGLLGLLAFGVGLLVVVPVLSVASTHIYRKLDKA